VVALVSAGSWGSAAAPAHATSLSRVAETAMYGPDVAVRSSTGHHLELSIEVIADRAADTQLFVELSRGIAEDHSWTFDVPKSEFVYNPSTGAGSFTVNTSIAPYGQLALTIVSAGPARTQRCDAASKTVTRRVAVTGTISFDTRSAGRTPWGTVSTSRETTKFQGPTKVAVVYGNVNKSCQAVQKSPCQHQVFWNGPGGVGGAISGESTKVHGHFQTNIEWVRTETPPNSPTNSSRSDFSFRRVPRPTIRRHGDLIQLVVNLGKAPGVTGSAILSAIGKPQHKRFSCGGHFEQSTTWTHARFENGGVPLRIVNQIFGDGFNPNSAKGGVIGFNGIVPPAAN
jgi:hypothetical protein